MVKRANIADIPEFYVRYVERIPEETDLAEYLLEQNIRVQRLFADMDSEKQMYRYAEGKWTPKQVLNHMTDMERVFQYRTLCFARNEKAPLPGADENQYELEADSNRLTMDVLLDEFSAVRLSTVSLIRSIRADAWGNTGIANGKSFVLLALPSIIAGHVEHHVNVVMERYN